MSSNPDFNWVIERNKCSVAIEFFELRKDADKDAKVRHSQVNSTNIGFQVLPAENNKNQFAVRRFGNGKDAQITFDLNGDHILISDAANNTEIRVTVSLNDDGECRFRVNGDGEFTRWQILKKALEQLFFENI